MRATKYKNQTARKRLGRRSVNGNRTADVVQISGDTVGKHGATAHCWLSNRRLPNKCVPRSPSGSPSFLRNRRRLRGRTPSSIFGKQLVRRGNGNGASGGPVSPPLEFVSSHLCRRRQVEPRCLGGRRRDRSQERQGGLLHTWSKVLGKHVR